MIEEIWKDVKDYEGLYQVSNMGNVRSLDKESWNGSGWFIKKGRILKPAKDKKGYLYVNLHKDGKSKTRFTHRLVMMAFSPCENMDKLEVDHINTITDDNRLENLKWVTRKENMNNTLTKIHNSEAQKKNNNFQGENNPWYGKSRSGKNNPFYGKHHTDKTKEEIGKKSSTKIRCVETGEVFNSQREASKKMNISKGSINSQLKGRYKTAGGYTFEYITEEGD